MKRFTGYLLLFAALGSTAAAATLPRVRGAVSVDGDLSDTLWQQALHVTRFYDIRTTPNGEPPVRTEALLGYDSAYLYVAFSSEDPSPEDIRAPLVPRDAVTYAEDMVQVDVDGLDDGKSSVLFAVNAHGVQRDGIYTEATEADDYAPDFDYESATRITSHGWEAEMRIPLSSLRYAQRDPQSWRISLYRIYPRDHRYRLRSAPVENGQTCWLCNAPRFDGITGLGSASTLVVTPHTTTRAVAPVGGRAIRDVDAGADGKWLAGPSLSLDATIHPDFSQTESDVSQLTLNQRFAIAYPEKRPFFMEGTDLLASPIQAIQTRTITSPTWGARVTGRPGNHAFTMIAAGDRGGGSIIVPGPVSSSLAPQQNALALLGRYRYSAGASSAGLLATARTGNGYSNQVFGPDAEWRPAVNQRIAAQFLASRTRNGKRSDGHAALLTWYRTSAHLTTTAAVEELSRDFRADSGYVPQTGVRLASGNAVISLYPAHVSALRGELAFQRVEQAGGGLVTQTVSPKLSFEGWRGATGELAYFPGETVQAADGRTRSQSYAVLSLQFLPSRHVPYVSIKAQNGEEVDFASGAVGDGKRLALVVRLQPIAPMFAEITSAVHRLALGGSDDVDAQSLDTRVTWTFTPRAFARLITDGQRTRFGSGTRRGFVNTTLLCAYRVTWETSVYAGYGDSRLIDESGVLGAPRREIFIKASYAVRTALRGGS